MQVFKTPDGHTVYTDGEMVVHQRPNGKREQSKIVNEGGRESRVTSLVEYPVTEVYVAGTSFLVEGEHEKVAEGFGHKAAKAKEAA
jgi:hypothetical protein